MCSLAYSLRGAFCQAEPLLAIIELQRMLEPLNTDRAGMTAAAAARDDRQQIVVMSWLAKAHLKLRDFDGCSGALARIRKLRAGARDLSNTAGINGPPHGDGRPQLPHMSLFGFTGSRHGDGDAGGAGIKGGSVTLGDCLVSHCAQPDAANLDLGELAARNLMHAGRLSEAFNTLAPTIVSAEAVVSQMQGALRGLPGVVTPPSINE